MFTLNPLGNPDAWWQHLIMIVVAAVIGYIIGQIGNKESILALETKLGKLDADLASCQLKKAHILKASTDNYEVLGLTETIEVPATNIDDLKVIEGIGLKIEEILHMEGIHTFRQLSLTSADHLTKILQDSGTQFQIHDPRTWPQQAQLAADGLWSELKELQNELNKGRHQ